MKLIYIVEDHDVIRTGVSQYLELSGFEVKGQANLAEAKKAIAERLPDLIIQDVMLPDGDGFVFIKNLKKEYPQLPVIFMTARTEESDRILGFELGADDYISKPFSPKELVLRVQALFRRLDSSQEAVNSENPLFESEEGNKLLIDEGQHIIRIDDEEIPLTAAEWRILLTLSNNAGELVVRNKILEECFDYSFESYERVVDTHIKNIRAKLKPGNWIDTVRGYGYKFVGKRV
ncbi:MAG: response regulator transcription factor [Sphaerochaetaceae bacterium]|nr:response regulator transcription factor [Sphaerochaetaceae bacterium]